MNEAFAASKRAQGGPGGEVADRGKTDTAARAGKLAFGTTTWIGHAGYGGICRALIQRRTFFGRVYGTFRRVFPGRSMIFEGDCLQSVLAFFPALLVAVAGGDGHEPDSGARPV